MDPGILLKAEGQLFSAASAASDAWFTAEFGPYWIKATPWGPAVFAPGSALGRPARRGAPGSDVKAADKHGYRL